MAEMTKDEAEFLALLSDEPRRRKDLPLADRRQDRIRQSCRAKGFAEFVGGMLNGPSGMKRYPMGWRITAAGKAARVATGGKE